MKLKAFHNKVRRRLGKDVKIEGTRSVSSRYSCLYGDYVLSWLAQDSSGTIGNVVDESSATACNFHARRQNDHSDLQTDYFAGSYFTNGTQLLDFVCPPPAKYVPGSLVRGKKNKRAIRSGYADKLALVTESSGKYMILQFVGEESNRNRSWYPDRDFELV